MALFPMFVKLEGRPCLVVGAGRVAEAKIRSLLATGAAVRVVGRSPTSAVKGWARTGRISWAPREFDPGDLDGVVVVVSATSPEVNERVCREARRRGVLANVVDEPLHCDFYYPAVVRRGDLQIAISTGGNSPALAQRLRKELEKRFGPEYESWVRELGKERKKLLEQAMDPRHRRRLLHRMASQEPERPRR
ncbi:MAG TPA: bifunctional precorrin-2 dehydrogenase/sirohydrochlorin ferrochelatase [Candidatus Acidoferrales bacterium]|nr:bifunctional precorrin-2 dehydrogenase/sirohydrochlorin ferrochelatase [Candidatus Acidoferrales bacterium]